MSHIVTLDLIINDLDALAKASEKLGCELVRNVKSYKWFGKYMGDYPLPKDMEKENLGKCDHVIRVKNPANQNAYEIGVVKNKNGSGYILAYDFWQGGYGLEEKVGTNCASLKQRYTAEAVLNKIKGRRDIARMEEKNEKGKLKLTITLR